MKQQNTDIQMIKFEGELLYQMFLSIDRGTYTIEQMRKFFEYLLDTLDRMETTRNIKKTKWGDLPQWQRDIQKINLETVSNQLGLLGDGTVKANDKVKAAARIASDYIDHMEINTKEVAAFLRREWERQLWRKVMWEHGQQTEDPDNQLLMDSLAQAIQLLGR